MLQIGFTGTQRGMTPPQRATFLRLLQELRGPHTLHHGDCIGADAEAHDCVKSLGWRVVIHPPIVGVKRAHCIGDEVAAALPYLIRNRVIVDETVLLISTPGEVDEQLRSGTWSAIRYARSRSKQVIIDPPSGELDVAKALAGIAGGEGNLDRLAQALMHGENE